MAVLGTCKGSKEPHPQAYYCTDWKRLPSKKNKTQKKAK